MSRSEDLRIVDVLRIPEVRAAMLGTFVVMLGFGILSPVLPNYARSFGVGYDSIGLLISAFSFARLLADPFVGRYIDRYGERRMVVLGAVVVGVSSVASALAPTFTLLVIYRGVGGVGSALFFAALLSFLLRTIPSERTGRVMSVFYASFNIGFIMGGPLGGLIANRFGLASPLYIYGVACFLSAIVFWRAIYDPDRHESEVRRGGLRRLPWGRPFVTVLVVNLVYLWVIGAVFQTLIPLFGTDEVGLTLGGVGLALAVATATELVSLYPAGSATDRRGRRAVLIPALAGLAVVVGTLGLATTPVVFMVAMAGLGVASGYSGVPPAPMLSDVTPEELKGSAVAVFRFAGDLGFVVGPLVAGAAANTVGFTGAFAISAIPAIVALGLVLSIAETKGTLPKSDEAPGF
ncbi:MAG TPA: MFS transporter [Actinomycetota bacterium]|nr:MFS transporter [Actinomycetota bacterium]